MLETENPRAPSSLVNRVAVFAVAFGLCVLWGSRYSETAALQNDATGYFQAAVAILHGTLNRMLVAADGSTFSDIAYPNFLSVGFAILGTSFRTAQILNGVLWGCSSLLVFSILSSVIPGRRALAFALATAASPMLTSFSGKIYSEHLAIFGGMLCAWGFYRKRRIGADPKALLAILVGGLVLVLTKSAFYFLFVLLLPLSLLRRDFVTSACSLILLLLVLPVQSHLHRGTRGAIQVAAQTAKIDLQSYPVIFECAVYNLSLHLGEKIFPGAEGFCRLNIGGTAIDAAEKEENYETVAFKKVAQGFSYRDGALLILKSPVKYAAIGTSTLFAAGWIEGFFPDPISNFPVVLKTLFWIFKVTLSTALWCFTALFFRNSFRSGRHRDLAIVLGVPTAYVFLFQFNVPAEQRYFFPLIPVLYIAAATYLTDFLRRKS